MSPGYGRVLKDAVDDGQLTKSEIVTLLTLSFYANGQADHLVADVSIPVLARRAGVGRSHAWSHLAKLQRLGYIVRETPEGRHPRYRFRIYLVAKGPESGPLERLAQVPNRDRTGFQMGTLDRSRNGTAYKVSRSSSRSSSRGNSRQGKGASEEETRAALEGLEYGF